MKTTSNTLGLLGAALISSIAFGNTAFAMEPVSQGFQLAAAKVDGEGKCGADHKGSKTEGSCGAHAKTGKAEGKCGEGKCGANKGKSDMKMDMPKKG